MFGAEVNVDTGFITAFFSLMGVAILGLFGWVLTSAVRLGQIVSRLESQTEDHERRLNHLESFK